MKSAINKLISVILVNHNSIQSKIDNHKTSSTNASKGLITIEEMYFQKSLELSLPIYTLSVTSVFETSINTFKNDAVNAYLYSFNSILNQRLLLEKQKKSVCLRAGYEHSEPIEEVSDSCYCAGAL